LLAMSESPFSLTQNPVDTSDAPLPRVRQAHQVWLGSGRSPQRDDGQVLTTFEMTHVKLELHTSPAPHRLRGALRRLEPERKSLAGLEAQPIARRLHTEVHFVRRGAPERRVRAHAVIPKAEHADLLAHLRDTVRHQHLAHPRTLEGRPESLDERDAPALADRSKPRLDAMAVAASQILLTELAPLVTDEGLGSTPSRRDSHIDQLADLRRARALS